MPILKHCVMQSMCHDGFKMDVNKFKRCQGVWTFYLANPIFYNILIGNIFFVNEKKKSLFFLLESTHFSKIDSTWYIIFILTCIECRARSSVNIRDHYKYKWFTANSSYEESFKEVFIVIPDISTRMRP